MSCEVINNQAVIAVENVGEAKAEFEAEVSFMNTRDMVDSWKFPASFRCRWEDPTKEKAEVHAGKTRRLLIASFKHVAHTAGAYLEFHPLAEDGQPFDVAMYIPGCIPPLQIPEIVFNVTITSSPKALNGPFSKVFRISPAGVFEEVVVEPDALRIVVRSCKLGPPVSPEVTEGQYNQYIMILVEFQLLSTNVPLQVAKKQLCLLNEGIDPLEFGEPRILEKRKYTL